MDSIYTAVIGKTAPYMGNIRDPKGNVLFENPLLHIDDVRQPKGLTSPVLLATYQNGPKQGEQFYFDPCDVMLF